MFQDAGTSARQRSGKGFRTSTKPMRTCSVWIESFVVWNCFTLLSNSSTPAGSCQRRFQTPLLG